MTANQARKFITESLVAIYPLVEADAIARRLLEDKFSISQNDMILRGDVLSVDDNLLDDCLLRLKNSEPIQYITGFEEFCGLRLAVSTATLIPRAETEILVRLIVSRVADIKNLKILDIGTGSGAIALALAHQLPGVNVSALDISKAALEIAVKNAISNRLNIRFLHGDILTYTSNEKFDIIVSNPPYVTDSERAFMHSNVLDFEPHSALFVPDLDPLRFYTAITNFAVSNLNPNGQLFFEINENFASQISDLLANNGFTDIQIHNDLNDKSRIVCAHN